MTHATPAVSEVPSWCVRYIQFCSRWAGTMVLASVLLAAIALRFTLQLPVFADFSYLLPQKSESVQHLRALEKRAQVLGTLMVAIVAPNETQRSQAAQMLETKLQSLDGNMVAHLNVDRHVARNFAWENRWLLASEADLEHAQRALGPYLAKARKRQNLLAMDFEDTPAPAVDAAAQASEAGATQADSDEALQSLRKRLQQLEQDSKSAGAYISEDGTTQLMVLQTPFSAGNTRADAALLARLAPMMAEVHAQLPDVQVGLAGDVLSSLEEQRSILQGMALSTAATIALVILGLYVFYRSLFGTIALGWALLVGTLCTFMLTRLVVGHLNIATAFLASIVLGNGINFGIMLMARYFEALGDKESAHDALIVAVADSWRGTLAAALAAAAAYGSLVITDFRGFRDFGLIAGMGMTLCWLSAYVLVPPLLALGARRNWLHAHAQPAIGRALLRLVPQANRVSLALLAVGTLAVTGLSVHYLATDPYEDNFRNLRSDSGVLQEEQRWMHVIDKAFGQGISGGFVMAVPDPQRVPELLQRLRQLDEGKPREQRLFSRINALQDFIPNDPSHKLALLQQIRTEILAAEAQGLPAPAKRALRKLTPPQDIKPLALAAVPDAIAWPFTEADGSRGKLILASPGFGYEMWHAQDLMRFAATIRSLSLGPDVLIGGSAFVFSDMVRLIEHDGPLATVAACIAACIAVVIMLGWTRHAAITLFAGAVGVFAMLAGCSLLRLRINFLDFVALPITIGIGIDYAVNLCSRSLAEGRGKARWALQHAGGAICLASYTTIIGYGSMLLSSNKGIRSFGHAAILGEATCLIAGLIVAPMLLDVFWPARPATDAATPPA